MHEPLWQPLVMPALCRTMGLKPECFYSEVHTMDGSICDLVYATGGMVIGFELKKSTEFMAQADLNNRGLRQLRHFRAACDHVYLVTVGGPRRYKLGHDGHTVELEPQEAQALPDGTGWIAFDRFDLDATILVPAPQLSPDGEHRTFLVSYLLGRLGRATRALEACVAI